MEPPVKRLRLDGALARWSYNSTCALPSVLQGKEAKGPSGAQKRAAAAALAPAKNCFRLISAPNKDPHATPIQFYLADMRCLLRYVAQKCPSFATFLRSLGPARAQAIISHDETTGGNVLCTEQRLKVTLFYATFREMQDIHESPRAWLPIGAVTHEQINAVRGGLGKIHALFIEDWCQQKLDQGVEVLPALRLKIGIQAFVADMDAQKQALCAKGSAGFHSICEPDVEKFDLHTQADLQAYMAAAFDALPTMTSKDQDLLEKCLGYRLSRDGMWNSPACCAALPLEKYVNDSMHMYFANGVACTEINLLVAAVWKETKQGISDIRDAVLEVSWERPGMKKRNGHERPKHHHALHLARQYNVTHCTPNCWGTEAKHRDYKQTFAKLLQHRLSQKNGGSSFSWSLLPRLLMRHCEFLNMHPLTTNGFELMGQFSAEDTYAVTNLKHCQVAPRCRIGMLDVQETDILLHGEQKEKAFRINFFIMKENQLYVHVNRCDLIKASAALRQFRLTATREVLSSSFMVQSGLTVSA
eukprot:s2238_g7.t1